MPVVLVGIPLLLVLAALVAYGFSPHARSQAQGLVSWLEGVAEGTLFLGFFAASALKLTAWLTHYLGQYFARSFHFAVQLISGLSQYLKLTAEVALAWPIELFRVQERLIWHTIPRLIQAAIRGIGHEAHAAITILRPVTKIVYRVPKITRAAALAAVAAVLPHGIRADLPLLRWLREHFKALTHALAAAGAIATTLPGRITHDVTVPFGRTIAQIKRRLRALEKVSVGGLAVGAVALALTRMGVNWIRCNNVKKIGKGLCSAPGWLINLLAAGVVEAFIVTDLCGFTDLLIKEAERFVPTLMELVDVEDALIGCHGTVKLIDFALPSLSLAPMPGPSVLAA